MNTIAIKQNEQIQLERLSAQREIYSSAKRLHIVQIIITVFIPIALFVLSFIWSNLIPYSALVGILVFVLDSICLAPSIKQQKIKASKIQELFDCDVLEIDKSPLKTVSDVTVEEILLNYNAHKKIATDIEKIRDWYPTNISELPISLARIICQRTNCWWDSTLRIRYSNCLKYFGLFVFLSIFVFSFVSKLDITTLTLYLSGIIPLFQFCHRECCEQKETAQRLDELVRYAEQIWNYALDNPTEYHEHKLNSRRLQDEIFEHRSKSPLILDAFYNLLRKNNELLMNRSAEILIDEAKRRRENSR